MAISVTHALQTTVPESTGSGSASGIIGPTEWNAQHIITGTLTIPISATVTSSAYTFVIGDAGGYVPFNSTNPQSATVPPNSSVAFPLGTLLTIEQGGVGPVSILSGVGVVINPGITPGTAGQYAVISLIQKAINVWTAIG